MLDRPVSCLPSLHVAASLLLGPAPLAGTHAVPSATQGTLAPLSILISTKWRGVGGGAFVFRFLFDTRNEFRVRQNDLQERG
jgi:hypothetical protein